MGNDLAYAMFLIHQRRARNLGQQTRLQQLFVSFMDGHIDAEQYESNLERTVSDRGAQTRYS